VDAALEEGMPMREVTPETAADYLREAGRVPGDAVVTVRALGWGVSNVVMRVEVEGRPSFVLKQARERLRTRAHWVSRLDRIWTEHAALECLAPLLPAGAVPEVLFVDRENYVFAMTSAPPDAVVWKERLLGGTAEPAVARDAADLLGTIHATTADHPALARADGPFADTVVFDQLRVDPFYRTIARVHPHVAAAVGRLCSPPIDLARHCFVHADFSPKNILVHSRGLTLVDFETAHRGDPAYDLGFFLSHLLLKAARSDLGAASAPEVPLIRVVIDTYHRRVAALPFGDLDRRAAAHAAANALARVDGKSPVDYLDHARQQAVRRFALDALLSPATACDDLVPRLARELPGNLRR
jgi:5-methylthioribose kinase